MKRYLLMYKVIQLWHHCMCRRACILYDIIYLFINSQQRREARFIEREREKQISNVDNQRQKEKERQTEGSQSYQEWSVQICISMADLQHHHHHPGLATPPPHTHPLKLHSIQCTQQTQKGLQRLLKYVQKYDFFISTFIVPPVLLQTISTLRSLLMACRRWIQRFFSY